jgi:hypothetical protein
MAHSNRYAYKKRPARRRTGLSFGEIALLVIAVFYLWVFFRQDIPKSYTMPEYESPVSTNNPSQPPRQLEL